MNGSPPRMRGKLQVFARLYLAHRITPAHAGKTQNFALFGGQNTDHPRACGENLQLLLAVARWDGSPPRMRGKLLFFFANVNAKRITPAHAGKTSYELFGFCAFSDHPRACGENEENAKKFLFPHGSPPRMRGKHFGNGVFPWLILVLSLNPL